MFVIIFQNNHASTFEKIIKLGSRFSLNEQFSMRLEKKIQDQAGTSIQGVVANTITFKDISMHIPIFGGVHHFPFLYIDYIEKANALHFSSQTFPCLKTLDSISNDPTVFYPQKSFALIYFLLNRPNSTRKHYNRTKFPITILINEEIIIGRLIKRYRFISILKLNNE